MTEESMELKTKITGRAKRHRWGDFDPNWSI